MRKLGPSKIYGRNDHKKRKNILSKIRMYHQDGKKYYQHLRIFTVTRELSLFSHKKIVKIIHMFSVKLTPSCLNQNSNFFLHRFKEITYSLKKFSYTYPPNHPSFRAARFLLILKIKAFS